MKLLNDFFRIEKSEVTDENYICRIRLNTAHTIYRAHFPGNPITPGVCLVQMVTECLEQFLRKSLYLKEVKNVKFLSILSPVENDRVTLVFSKTAMSETECNVQAIIVSAEIQYAKMSLIYAYEPV